MCKTLPNPVGDYITSLNIPPPTSARPISFFDPPESELTAKARAFVHDLLPSWGENHCYRTYAFGLSIASTLGWTQNPEEYGWDKELWFLAAILHDIGWDAQENFKTKLSFEIYGGIKARELLNKWGAKQEDADEVCEAIIRHTDGLSPLGSVRVTAALVQLGAIQDLLGPYTPSLIHPSELSAICARWPRNGISTHVVSYLERETATKPGCLLERNGAEFVTKQLKAPSAVYAGIQGRPEEGVDEAWEERRKGMPSF